MHEETIMNKNSFKLHKIPTNTKINIFFFLIINKINKGSLRPIKKIKTLLPIITNFNNNWLHFAQKKGK